MKRLVDDLICAKQEVKEKSMKRRMQKAGWVSYPYGSGRMVEVIKNGRRCSFCHCDVGNDALTSMRRGIYLCAKCCKEEGPASVKFSDGRLLCLAKMSDKRVGGAPQDVRAGK